jgi:hypothetical protein
MSMQGLKRTHAARSVDLAAADARAPADGRALPPNTIVFAC